MALYDNGGALISGASGVYVNTTSGNNGTYLEITGLSAVIASGTFYICFQSSGTGEFRPDALASGGAGPYYGISLYSAFPLANLHAQSGVEGKIPQVGVFVQ